MCGICGCSGEGESINANAAGHAGALPHSQPQKHGIALEGEIASSVAAFSPDEKSRLIAVERNLLARNDAYAKTNRAHFLEHRLLALNLVSSPGAGKTSLLVATAPLLAGVHVGVIEGDQRTDLDADRIRAAGLPAVQINTGKGCHLEAEQVGRAFDQLHHLHDGILFIENVGNLVCPAAFDLGETHRVVVASVTEGEDKPLKYPDMFASADLLVVSKIDIAEACMCDVALLIANARKVRPGLKAICLSARTGAGMDTWIAWLKAARAFAAVGV